MSGRALHVSTTSTRCRTSFHASRASCRIAAVSMQAGTRRSATHLLEQLSHRIDRVRRLQQSRPSRTASSRAGSAWQQPPLDRRPADGDDTLQFDLRPGPTSIGATLELTATFQPATAAERSYAVRPPFSAASSRRTVVSNSEPPGAGHAPAGSALLPRPPTEAPRRGIEQMEPGAPPSVTVDRSPAEASDRTRAPPRRRR